MKIYPLEYTVATSWDRVVIVIYHWSRARKKGGLFVCYSDLLSCLVVTCALIALLCVHIKAPPHNYTTLWHPRLDNVLELSHRRCEDLHLIQCATNCVVSASNHSISRWTHCTPTDTERPRSVAATWIGMYCVDRKVNSSFPRPHSSAGWEHTRSLKTCMFLSPFKVLRV